MRGALSFSPFSMSCRTATGITDPLNEVMHLAAGVQLAGFRSLIVHMWSVGDQEAEAVTVFLKSDSVNSARLIPWVQP